ncbi:histidine utilization repressor [Alicyclobacillus hesperidum subsp. aegles]|uniref:GntR family transcriptional regulator n=1 Tax=Alicyclobacillus hesperidum TaxID=89784 RepID=UPI0022288706|nr:GntR family transcriptional regulator [Alicyclobacillus hesperidum]GLG00895.1 histidine utilization repressor [Alicyclobacillus hesperidum subsp. aegles]
MRESVPLYKQLKAELLSKIRNGEWEAGQQLPSEAELATLFAVSRTTVRQAVGDLVSSGFVIRRQGKGTYVAEQAFHSTATTLYGFAEELRAAGYEVNIVLDRLEERECPEDVAAILRQSKNRRILYVERTAHVDDLCYFRETSYIVPPYHIDLAKVISQRLAYDYIYGFFEQNGVRINSGNQTISAELADETDCSVFQLEPPAAVLAIERITRDESGAAVEYSHVRYPASRYRLHLNLLRHTD